MSEKTIVRRSIANRKPGKTNWAQVDRLTDAQIKDAVGSDPDAAPILDKEWFASAKLMMPETKQPVTIRLDRDVLDHFKRYPRYQTRINAILRSIMEHERKVR